MGGPLVDLDGHIIGINIARAGRISSYALPASDIQQILDRLDLPNRKDDAPFDDLPAGLANDAALRREADRAEKAVEEARRLLEAAEERAKKAREALDRER